ncbi:conserved hypothetical protein [Rubrivivax sp. A210]|uniref:hypothetical protein n=1 Tax=Rubrivivax sp. A210 TaxID=2772301 RepID=UPI00191ACF09|nr:hypothetical protein [Rubrivivax sp. A210]CAD5371909.1 conserved hypothetical protein [Rubrivivax sp. A210]
MSSPVRLIIFGLMRDASAEEIAHLVGRGADGPPQMVGLPGDSDEAYAVVQLASDRGQAMRLAWRLNHAHFHGRHLQCWVPALPWL